MNALVRSYTQLSIPRLWHLFLHDSLFRNSLYLMSATAVLAAFGFVFWIISARLVSPEHIGIATTLISTMNMIAILSLIGFDIALVRFLPKSRQPNEKINTTMVLVGSSAFTLAMVFVFFVQSISPDLAFVSKNPFTAGIFILFCVMSALNVLTDSIFLAYRQTKYSLIINAIFSVLKILLPFFFVSWGAMGIFTTAALAQSVGFLISIGVLMHSFSYRPSLRISFPVVSQLWHYSMWNYLNGILHLVPVLLLPIFITNRLGPSQAAYYYIVMMIGNFLYDIPRATTQSLFAEGSHDEQSLAQNSKKSFRIIASLLFPAMLLLFGFGKYILMVFGHSYSSESTLLLYCVVFTAIPISINSIIGSSFRVKKKMWPLVVTDICYAFSVLGFSYLLISWGLLGIGIALFIGMSIVCVLNYVLHAVLYTSEQTASRLFFRW